MLELFVHIFARDIIADEDLKPSRDILNGREARLAHDAFEHDSARNLDVNLLLVALMLWSGPAGAASSASSGRAGVFVVMVRCVSNAMIPRIVNILAYEKFSDALFEAGFNKLVEIAVENTLGIANFNISAQVFNA